MVEEIKDFGLSDIKKEAKSFEEVLEKLNVVLKEKLGVSIDDMTILLSAKTIEKAEEITLELKNIAPYADYSKLLEDNDSMTQFIKEEAHKPENWILQYIGEDQKFAKLLKFEFLNKAADEGETIKGKVFVSKSGVIRHAMVAAQE